MSAQSPPRLAFTWIESPAAFFRLRREWDAWHASLGVDNVFQSYDWIRLWLRFYEPGARLQIGIARAADAVVGIAPLFIADERITKVGPRMRSVRIMGDGTLCPDHIVLPVRAGFEEPFAAGIVERLHSIAQDWDRVELRDLLGGQPVLDALRVSAAVHSDSVAIRERTHCPYIPLPATWDEYLATLGAKTRKTIRQRLQKIQNELAAEPTYPRDRADVDRMMLRLEDLHTRSWEERGRPGVFASRRFRTFHRLHARRSFRSGRLWMFALRARGKDHEADQDIAVTLGFRDARAAHGYQLGHDPEHRTYGIGSMMVALAIRSAIEAGLQEMDFLRGAGMYKYHLTAHERRGHDLVIHSGSVSDRTASMAAGVRRRAGTALAGALGPERKQWVKRRLRMS